MKKISSMLMILLTVFNFSFCGYAQNEKLIYIDPSEDTYAIKGIEESKHFLDETVYVKGKSSEIGYFFFHLDKIPNTEDKFYIEITPRTVEKENGEYIPNLYVCSVSTHDIKTSELTYSGISCGTGSIAQFEPVAGDKVVFDVTDYVKNNLSGKNNIGFALTDRDDFDTVYTFNSRESKEGSSVKLLIGKNSGVSIDKLKVEEKENSSTMQVENYLAPRNLTLNAQKIEYTNLGEDVDIDDYTTIRYKPWIVNYHMTDVIQIENDYYGGDAGQSCYAMAVSPTDPNIVLLGSDTEAIYRSDNGGINWISSADGLGTGAIEALGFYPDDGNIVFALCGRRQERFCYGMGIYKSTDSGKSWRCVNPIISGHQQVTRHGPHFAFSEKKEDGTRRIWAQSYYSGVYYSDDMGENWEYLGFKGEKTMFIQSYENKLIVGSNTIGIKFSDDMGETWQERSSETIGTNIYSVEINPDNKKHWICVGNEDILYQSFDEGKTWEYLSDIIDIKGETKAVETMNLSAVGIGFVRFMAPDENGNRTLAMMTRGGRFVPRYSNDYGKTWHSPEIRNDLAYIESNWGAGAHPLVVHPTDPDIGWCSMDGEIYKTVDGFKTLYPASSGYSGHRASGEFLFNPNDPYDWWFFFTDRGMARSIQSGRGEEYPAMVNEATEDKYDMRMDGIRDMSGAVRDPKNPERYLMWSKKGSILESLDGGWEWQTVSGPKGLLIKFSDENPNTIYCGKYISYDDGKTWSIFTERAINAISPLNENIMYSKDGGDFYKSDDRGKSWTHLFHAGGTIQKIRPDIVDENKVYIGTYNKGIKVYDGKEMTTLTGMNLGPANIAGFYDVAQNPTNPNHLVTCNIDNNNVGRSGGISESFDGGKTWRHIEGIPITADAWSMKFHPTLPKVFIGTSLGTFVYECDKYYDMSEKIFLDTSDSPYKNEIDYLYNHKILGLYTDGNFGPKESYTREEFADIIRHAFNLTYSSTKQIFADVDIWDRCFVNVGALYENGLVTGTGNSEFNKKGYITYDDAAVILNRYLKKNGIGADFDIGNINLDSKSAPYAQYAVATCMELGIINTNDYNGYLAATREDMAKMVYKVLELTGKLEV